MEAGHGVAEPVHHARSEIFDEDVAVPNQLVSTVHPVLRLRSRTMDSLFLLQHMK